MAGANPRRGEAELGTHRIVVDFNAWCIAEAAMGATQFEIISMMKRNELGCRGLRTLLRAFLAEDLPLDQVGDLIGTLGEGAVGEALTAALKDYFPPAPEKKQNPPKAG